jgi:hypothetical protein
VTNGLITVEVGAGRADVGWLIGGGDLIRPWEMADISLTQSSKWRAITDASMLRIERVPHPRGQPGPATLEKLLACSARTTHWLLAKSLILSSPSISERLLLLFALWGERWGKVTPEGVRVELPLTHELLGKLCGARRPTVTVAIKALTQEGFLTQTSRGVWLLHRRPDRSRAYACWTECATALGFSHACEVSRLASGAHEQCPR